jgi:pectin methylesterase-like acyl-CoA thioesterase
LLFSLIKPSRVIGTGTFGCGTFIVEGEDFIAENITFENSAPQVLTVSSFVLLPQTNEHAVGVGWGVDVYYS